MIRNQFFIVSLTAAYCLLTFGCPSPDPHGQSTNLGTDLRMPPSEETPSLGESVSQVIFLAQNWTPEETIRFYNLSHGSRLIPYSWLINLKQAGTNEMFISNSNMRRLRYLPQSSPGGTPKLPVGFVKDGDLDWVGLNCAACHTNQINYKGKGIRIDGAPAQADLDSFLRELLEALIHCRDNPGEFSEFAKNVLGEQAKSDFALQFLKTKLELVIQAREKYNERNLIGDPGDRLEPRAPWGYARIDAIGSIFNQATSEALNYPKNSRQANAPVSIPFIWDTPQLRFVEWNASVENSQLLGFHVGALGRNVGEVLGVFGEIRIDKGDFDLWPGYPSSVRLSNIQESENLIRKLWSPTWPGDIFSHPLTNEELLKQGAGLFRSKKCNECHALNNRTDPNRVAIGVDPNLSDEVQENELKKALGFKVELNVVGTDPLMAANFETQRDTGPLRGRNRIFLPGTEKFGDKAKAVDILAHLVMGAIIHSPVNENQELPPAKPRFVTATPVLYYKARPLNGVWATAPYLHNGSVPTLYDLLSPVAKRPKTFCVGQMEFDPDKVGYKQFSSAEDGSENGFFLFDTAVPGNSNMGHIFGAEDFEWNDGNRTEAVKALTDVERKALLEFLRSL